MTWKRLLKSYAREEKNFIKLLNEQGFTCQIYKYVGKDYSSLTEVKTGRQIASVIPPLRRTLETGQRKDELEKWIDTFTRSMEFVSSIVDSNSEIVWEKNNVSVTGTSGKGYNIKTTEMQGDECYLVTTQKEDFKICIVLSEVLSAGDNLGGLILTLLDDKSSSEHIEGIYDYLNENTYIECPFDEEKIKVDTESREGKCPNCQASYNIDIEDISFEPNFRVDSEFYVDPINTDKFRLGRLSHYSITYDKKSELFYTSSSFEVDPHRYNSDWVKPDDWNFSEDVVTKQRGIAFKVGEPPFFIAMNANPLVDVRFGMSEAKVFGDVTLYKDGMELTSRGIAKIVKKETGYEGVKFIKTLFDFLVDYPHYYTGYKFPFILGFEETEHKNVFKTKFGTLEIILQPDNTHTVKNVANPDTYEFYKSQKNLSSIAILDNNMKWTEYLKKSSTDSMENWEIALKSFIEEGKKIGVPLSVMKILQLAKEATTSQSEGFETLHRPTFSEEEEEEDV